MCNEHNCMALWTLFGIALLWDWNETHIFQSHGHCWVFQICWHIECSTFIALSFRIWNSSDGVPSLPLIFFTVLLPKAHLTSHSRMSGFRWVTTPLGVIQVIKTFFYIVLLSILATSLNLFCFCKILLFLCWDRSLSLSLFFFPFILFCGQDFHHSVF